MIKKNSETLQGTVPLTKCKPFMFELLAFPSITLGKKHTHKKKQTENLLSHSAHRGCRQCPTHGVSARPMENSNLSATHFSLRLTLTAEAEGGKEGFIPMLGVDALGMGVLSRVGLKPDEPKEKEAAASAKGEAPAGGASGV